jgi:hypothetical protein
MLSDKSLDYRQIVKELDYSCKYSIPETLAVVRILCDIRKTGLYDKKKLQKVLNHYAVEHENMLVLKR